MIIDYVNFLSFLNIFFNRFCPVEKCEVTPHYLYRDSLTLISQNQHSSTSLSVLQKTLTSSLRGNHPFKTFAKFSEKLTFSPPDTNTYVCVSGGKKCWFFGKVLICTKWIISEVICNASCSTGQSPVFPSYRNVLIDLYCKTIDCVLYHRRIGLEWFKFHFSYHYSMLFLNCSFFLS